MVRSDEPSFYTANVSFINHQFDQLEVVEELLEETRKEINNMRFIREVVEIDAEEYEMIHDYDKALENAILL